jgi:hypothetical protein
MLIALSGIHAAAALLTDIVALAVAREATDGPRPLG